MVILTCSYFEDYFSKSQKSTINQETNSNFKGLQQILMLREENKDIFSCIYFSPQFVDSNKVGLHSSVQFKVTKLWTP